MDDIESGIDRSLYQYGGRDRFNVMTTGLVHNVNQYSDDECRIHQNNDPWKASGITDKGNFDDSIVPIVIEGVSHSADIHTINPSDPLSFVAARNEILANIQIWMDSHSDMSYLKASSLLQSSPSIMIDHAEMYDSPLKNTIYIVFHHVSIVLSLHVNVILITLILRCRRKEFGAYRFLLLTFASVDIYYGLVHFLVMPIPEAWANAFYMGAHGYITGKVAVCWFAGAHSHSFVVLVFHFLYRLLAGQFMTIHSYEEVNIVSSSSYISLFSHRWFFGVQFLCVFLVGGAWYVPLLLFIIHTPITRYCVLYYLYDADQFVIDYMEPILSEHAIGTALQIDQYSTAVFWTNGTFVGPRWKPIFGVFVMASTMSSGYGFMMYAAYKIGWYMKRTSSVQSKRTTGLQRQLMRALMYQTILPLVTAYSPPLISVVNPFLGLSLSVIADISPIFCGSHPWLDGCVLIWTIKEYRMLLFNCFRKKNKTGEREIRTTTIARSGTSIVGGPSIL
uniref:G protein-coupled receptor n=1 Tax=Pristionchus pacificus TaxID=54126 RepID=A0A8R1USB7_PRIPA